MTDFARELCDYILQRKCAVHFGPSHKPGLVACLIIGPGSHTTTADAAKAEDAFEVARLRHDARWSLAKGLGPKPGRIIGG